MEAPTRTHLRVVYGRLLAGPARIPNRRPTSDWKNPDRSREPSPPNPQASRLQGYRKRPVRAHRPPLTDHDSPTRKHSRVLLPPSMPPRKRPRQDAPLGHSQVETTGNSI